MKSRIPFKLDEKGQSVVEYALLLSVVMSIVLAVMRTDGFKRIFGDDSYIFEEFRKIMEHTYRHAYYGKLNTTIQKGSRNKEVHQSYFSTANTDTHFFYSPNSYGD